MGMLDPKDLERQLQQALKECASLREEDERLRKLLVSPSWIKIHG